MTEAFITRKRTGWDIVLGALLVIGGIIILANAVIATKVSILFLGWMLLIGGIIGLISACSTSARAPSGRRRSPARCSRRWV